MLFFSNQGEGEVRRGVNISYSYRPLFVDFAFLALWTYQLQYQDIYFNLL
jgi:hypothetical protein